MIPEQEEHGKFIALALISLCLIGALSTWFSATVILPELSQSAQLSGLEEIWLTNGVQLGFVLGALIISFFNISDIVSLTKLIAVSCICAALSNFLLGVANNGAQFVVLRVLTGAALAGVYPPCVKLIATWFKTGRGIAMGTIIGALTVGSALPHLLRAMAADTDWHTVIWGSSATTFLAGLVFALFVKEGPHAFARANFDPSQIFQVLRNRALALVNIGYIGHMWELYAMWAWILTFAHHASDKFTKFPLSSPEYLSFSVVAAGGIGCIIAGRLSDIYGRCLTTAGLMLISGFCAFFIGYTVEISALLFATVAIIWGATIVADSGQFSAAVTELSDQRLVGTALTFQMAIGYGVTLLTVWLVPIMAQKSDSFQWAFLILVPGPLIGAAAMLLLRQRDEATLLANGKR